MEVPATQEPNNPILTARDQVHQLTVAFWDKENPLSTTLQHPMFFPFQMSVLEVTYTDATIGASPLFVSTLDREISKLMPPKITRDALLSDDGGPSIQQIRKIAALIFISGEIRKVPNPEQIITECAEALNAGKLQQLISNEEMARVRNASMPQTIVILEQYLTPQNQEELLGESALSCFVNGIREGKSIPEIDQELVNRYPSDKTSVSFHKSPEGRLTSDFGYVAKQ